MSEKYHDKYRIETARLQSWDYGWNGAYFVTICTKDRIPYFGEVLQEGMQLSEFGRQANACWLEIPQHFPFVKLGAHVIMPDHVHGIVIIDKKADGQNRDTKYGVPSSVDANVIKGKFGPQSQNLASIVRGFKIGVTKYVRQIEPEFSWQARYHDRIIHDARAYDRASRYIINNPAKWFEKYGGK